MLKMYTLHPELKQLRTQCLSTTALLNIPDRRDAYKRCFLRLLTSFTISLAFSVLLFLSFLSLKYERAVLGCVAGLSLAVTTPALFISQDVRHFGLLFLISCGMRQGRNLLITAGTGIVIFWNVQNTFSNLKELARSMICNLETRRILIDLTPISNYVKMLKWIGKQLQANPHFGMVDFKTQLHVSSKVDSEGLENMLKHAEKMLNATADHVLGVMNTMSTISQIVGPVLGLFLVLVFTVLYARQYQHNKKFMNTFITSHFIEYDRRQQAMGQISVLPLTKNEAALYTTIPSLWFTTKEWKAMLKFSLPILTNFLVWVLFMVIDALIYWLIVIIKTHLESLEPFNVPLKVSSTEEKTIIGINFQDNRESRDFSYSVALFEEKCLPNPTLMTYNSTVPLSVILVVLAFLALLSGKLQQVRLLLSTKLYSQASDKRVQYLHSEIVLDRQTDRNAQKTALMKRLREASFWFPILFHDKDKDNF
uniref:Dendrocyte expressed seven transmembrane protein n=1 Tax=Paramormyrops kingsleyae TaxID=1676925 RepID=A0A3B3TDS6_9TELE|nr:dendritic cell-specific transmembrane protein [Paramormyrops kingsleyae]XP_023666832.1 dendritic cell-specific transmembrane protein [Paramormyrops kingsleyae]XP_023666842.1 dendritic cell-specific transmembrane protein [Paramormyrops kingsleyae]